MGPGGGARRRERGHRDSREAAPLDATLPAGTALDDADRWTLVEARGVYDTENEIVLRAQTNNGVNGFEIVTPLILEDGTRSWSTAASSAPIAPGTSPTTRPRLRARSP